jgi:hypothetical protein
MREIRSYGSVGAPGGEPPGSTRIAPGEAWERGKLNPETFQRDPAGKQSCSVKSGDQPEASLARTGVTRP